MTVDGKAASPSKQAGSLRILLVLCRSLAPAPNTVRSPIRIDPQEDRSCRTTHDHARSIRVNECHYEKGPAKWSRRHVQLQNSRTGEHMRRRETDDRQLPSGLKSAFHLVV
jgi:hypothetical protein